MQSLELKLNNYIAVSVLLHILLLAVLVNLRPAAHYMPPRVFEVDIAGPLEKVKPPEIIRLPAVPPAAPAEKPEQSIIPPRTMFDSGADAEPTQQGVQETLRDFGGESGKDLDSEEPLADGRSVLPEAEDGLGLEPRTYLFDEGTIEKYARMGIAKDKGLTFEAPEFYHRGYMRRLKDKIESIWKLPGDGAMPNSSIDLYIKFTINRDGSLGDVVLIRTSGYREFDEAAMQALKDAEPYWPLPPDWAEDDLTINGHFIYLMGRSLVM